MNYMIKLVIIQFTVVDHIFIPIDDINDSSLLATIFSVAANFRFPTTLDVHTCGSIRRSRTYQPTPSVVFQVYVSEIAGCV